jgi:hypothetical protein
MEHVVFSAAEGGVGEEFRRVSSLEEAVRVVEHLRNDLGITESSVFELTPVPLEFKAYYRVELPGVKLPVAAAEEIPAEIAELRVGDLSELPLEEPAEIASVEPLEPLAESTESVEAELVEPELTDQDFMPDFAGSDLALPALMPPAEAIPSTRQDGDAERSLGYFAR